MEHTCCVEAFKELQNTIPILEMEERILESGAYNPEGTLVSSLKNSLDAFRKDEKLSEEFRSDSTYSSFPFC